MFQLELYELISSKPFEQMPFRLDNPTASGSNPADKKPAKETSLAPENNTADACEPKTGAANGKRTGASHGDFAS
jgi:hypothetical protein